MSIKKNITGEGIKSGILNRFKGKHFSLKTAVTLLLVAIITAGSVISVAALGVTARITDGESVVSVLTLYEDTGNILQTAGILYNEDDVVISNKTSDRSIDITVYRAFDVNLVIDGEESTHAFNIGTVSDALDIIGVKVDENDRVIPDMNSELRAGMTIRVTHISDVSVTSDKKTINFKAEGGTVEQVLDSLGITYDDDDIISPSLDKQVNDGDKISVKRVEYKEKTEIESISYSTTTRKSSDVYIGETAVYRAGVKGEREVVKREKYVDGELENSETLSTRVLREPVDEIILTGTKQKDYSAGSVIAPAGTFKDASGKTVSYSKLLSGTCTAYTATGNLTSTGQVAQVGLVAVNPNIIPYGTKMYIASADGKYVYGYAIAADTGGALMDGTVLVDLYYDTEHECYQFGRRQMNVYILG